MYDANSETNTIIIYANSHGKGNKWSKYWSRRRIDTIEIMTPLSALSIMALSIFFTKSSKLKFQ